MRILIVKLGAVGDCLHGLVAASVLRRERPDAVIGWLVETKSQEVVLGHPLLDHVHVWNRKATSADFSEGRLRDAWREIERTIHEVRAVGYDVAIDLQNLFKSGFFAWRSGAPMRIGFSRMREGNFLFTTRRVRTSEAQRHMVHRYLSLLAPLGITARDDPPAVPIMVPDDQRRATDSFFERSVPPGRPVVAINPAASLSPKVWPAERFAAVADRLVETHGITPLLIWGPGEEPLVDHVRQAMKRPALIAPPTTIKELAHLFTRCALYVGNDSGPMHLAAAMGCAVVGLFGPTDPRRVAPWSARQRAVEPFEPFFKNRSIDGVTIDQVYTAATELLGKRP
jgi:lipopolysaccharide heptosyltransferase I